MAHALLELVEFERAVVQRTGQAKTVFDQGGFARPVAVVHPTELANQHMAFVQKHERVFGQVIGQRGRRLARRTARQMPRVVLNALAVPHFAEHLQIKAGALLQALRLDQLTHAHQLFEAVGQLGLDGLHRAEHLFAGRDVMAAGVNREARDFLAHAAREWVKELQRLHFVVEQIDANGHLGVFGGENVDGVTPHAEFAARKILIVARVLHAHELRDQVALPDLVARSQRHHHLVVALGFADAVNGRDRGHDDDVAPLQNALGARQTHLLDVFVDGAVFFNEQIALRHVGLGLVVVVVADEILHRILREELAELAVELSSQGFVGGKHNGGPTQAGDHVGHGEGLTRARHAQQRLKHLTVAHTFDQLLNRRGLITGGRVRHEQLKRRIGEGHEFALEWGCSNFNGFGHGVGLGAVKIRDNPKA